jgi:hypothetical protein
MVYLLGYPITQQNNMEFELNTNIPIIAPIAGMPSSPLIQQLRGPIAQLPMSAPMTPQLPMVPKELNTLDRALNFNADHGGCGYWRMLWPEMLLNMYQKAVIGSSTAMLTDTRYYHGIKSVRIQRQATQQQLEFAKFLRHVSDKTNKFKMIYEIDDIIFREDIPDYNSSKSAFDNPIIAQGCQDIMELCDEITVTCEYMRQYYMSKTAVKNITVVPNYAPKFWFDRYYSSTKVADRLDKNKKRPRVGYFGSGTHTDVRNSTGQQDDFSHIIEVVTKTRKEFQWVFVGTVPLQLRQFIHTGDIEYHTWTSLPDYPALIDTVGVSATIAPLRDNIFNKSKSNIKYLEAACHGIPCVCQDLVTYAMAPLRFKTGDEMISQLRKLLSDRQYYTKHSKTARQYAETMWMEDHLDEYMSIYNIGKKL